MDEDERSDQELLTAHLAGDSQAFTALIKRHRDRLWSISLRTMRDPYEAEEALQDALLLAYRRANQYRGEAAVTTWLHRIVVNSCLDRLRHVGRRTTIPLPENLDGGLADEHDAMADVDMSMAIGDALAQLTPDRRAAVLLVDIEGLSISESARVLNCPEGTVKSRCARGRMQLAELLGYLRNPVDTSNVISKKGGDDNG